VFQLLAARAALVSLIAVTLFLGPSFGHLAIQDGNWPARLVMAGLLAGIWSAFFAYAAARERARRGEVALKAACQRMQAAIDEHADVDAGLRALLAAARTEIS
jgi:hypothetical protein